MYQQRWKGAEQIHGLKGSCWKTIDSSTKVAKGKVMEAPKREKSWLGAKSLDSSPAFTIWKSFDLEYITLPFWLSVTSIVKGRHENEASGPLILTGSFKFPEEVPSDVSTGLYDFAKTVIS